MNLVRIDDNLWVNPDHVVAIYQYNAKIYGEDHTPTGETVRKARIYTATESWTVDAELVAHLDPTRQPDPDVRGNLCWLRNPEDDKPCTRAILHDGSHHNAETGKMWSRE